MGLNCKEVNKEESNQLFVWMAPRLWILKTREISPQSFKNQKINSKDSQVILTNNKTFTLFKPE